MSQGIPKDTWGTDIIKQFMGDLRGLARWGLCNRKPLAIEYVTAITLIDIKELLEKELRQKQS